MLQCCQTYSRVLSILIKEKCGLQYLFCCRSSGGNAEIVGLEINRLDNEGMDIDGPIVNKLIRSFVHSFIHSFIQ